MEVKRSSTPHALVMPLPGQGHVNPLLELSYSLIDHGFRITFVATEVYHNLIKKANSDGDDGPEARKNIRLVSIKDGMQPDDYRRLDIGMMLERFSEVIPRTLEELVININGSGHEYGKITCIITDGNIAGAVLVGRKMGIPTAVLWPASACSLAILSQIPSLIRDGIINVDGTVAKCGMIKLLPTILEMDTAYLYWLGLHGTDYSRRVFFNYAKDRSEDLKATDWILCNTFYDLEKSAIELIDKVLPVGPLIQGRRHGLLEGNLFQEDSACLSWLDQQPADSVIYVAFGSTTFFNPRQLQELALGLELSAKRFLWVVRPGYSTYGGSEEEDDYHPELDIKDRVGDRGRIVGWSPQQKVLAHPAIACFFTHCGWNSTIEGLSNGVPFLCWPNHTDQYLNKVYITDVWKVGFEVKPEIDGSISREEIKRKLEELVGNKEIRARCLELKALARKNISDGGSSWKNFNHFIEAMKPKSE